MTRQSAEGQCAGHEEDVTDDRLRGQDEPGPAQIFAEAAFRLAQRLRSLDDDGLGPAASGSSPLRTQLVGLDTVEGSQRRSRQKLGEATRSKSRTGVASTSSGRTGVRIAIAPLPSAITVISPATWWVCWRGRISDAEARTMLLHSC